MTENNLLFKEKILAQHQGQRIYKRMQMLQNSLTPARPHPSIPLKRLTDKH